MEQYLLRDIGKSRGTGLTCNTQEHGHAANLPQESEGNPKMALRDWELRDSECVGNDVEVRGNGMRFSSILSNLWWYLFYCYHFWDHLVLRQWKRIEISCGFEMAHRSANFSCGLHRVLTCFDSSQSCVDLAADSTPATCHWQKAGTLAWAGFPWPERQTKLKKETKLQPSVASTQLVSKEHGGPFFMPFFNLLINYMILYIYI